MKYDDIVGILCDIVEYCAYPERLRNIPRISELCLRIPNQFPLLLSIALDCCGILRDLVGYRGILREILGYCGILWDIVEYCEISRQIAKYPENF